VFSLTSEFYLDVGDRQPFAGYTVHCQVLPILPVWVSYFQKDFPEVLLLLVLGVHIITVDASLVVMLRILCISNFRS